MKIGRKLDFYLCELIICSWEMVFGLDGKLGNCC